MIGDYAVPQRLHGNHVAGGSAQHIPGGSAHLQNLSRIFVQRHYAGLPDHQALSVRVNQHIGCTQINTQVVG